MDWDKISFFSRFIGFTLIFVGALVAAAFASVNGGVYTCSSASCFQNFVEGAANAILTGRVLMAIGAFLLGAGAGLKIHFNLKAPANPTPETMRWVIWERFFNYGLLAISIAILVAILWMIGGAPTPTATGA
jgi:hypothetical protein